MLRKLIEFETFKKLLFKKYQINLIKLIKNRQVNDDAEMDHQLSALKDDILENEPISVPKLLKSCNRNCFTDQQIFKLLAGHE